MGKLRQGSSWLSQDIDSFCAKLWEDLAQWKGAGSMLCQPKCKRYWKGFGEEEEDTEKSRE